MAHFRDTDDTWRPYEILCRPGTEESDIRRWARKFRTCAPPEREISLRCLAQQKVARAEEEGKKTKTKPEPDEGPGLVWKIVGAVAYVLLLIVVFVAIVRA